MKVRLPTWLGYGIISLCSILGAIVILLRFFIFGDAFGARISNARLCFEQDSTNVVGFVYRDRISRSDLRNLNICTFIETDGRPVVLLITVWSPDGNLIYDHEDRYDPGQVAVPFSIPNYADPGFYEAQIAFGREVLGKVVFELTEP